MSEPSAFQRLNPVIQEELYRMEWTALRPIQVDAIRSILGSNSHLIISANTAGGKTEAAFLPILSDIVNDHTGSVRALYVGPLKALINDQFRRLEDLCERAEIPVHKWHGDVGQSKKHKVLDLPGGVLLITPESIESLFINHPDKLDDLFPRLTYIVIDELHAFIGTARGAHLRSLMARLIQHVNHNVRIIGLSATLGDETSAQKWIDPKNPDKVLMIKGEEYKSIKYLIKGYRRLKTDKSHEDRSVEENEDDTIGTPDDFRLVKDIITAFTGKTALIFANKKYQLELYADLTGRMLSRSGQPNSFRVYHGSLSKPEREEIERALRSAPPVAVFCSSALELGIDVGNVSQIGQIGAPWSVSSLKQRLGRSGRHEEKPSILWMYVVEDGPSKGSKPVDRLYPQLLCAIAMTELMLEHWCEPPDIERWHLSTLVQQIMSTIAEAGGTSASTLYERLITKGSFGNIDLQTFISTLRGMVAEDLIEQTPEGLIILGLKGEQIVRSYDFYSAFLTEKELRVLHRGHLIGTVASSPSTGADGFLILAGRRWRVIETNLERDEILVEPSRGGRLPSFFGSAGPDLHPYVHEKMREILLGSKMPVYLDQVAKEMLQEARTFARESGILIDPFFRDGNDTTWFTWCGTRVNRTLLGLGLYEKMDVNDEEGIALTFDKMDPTEIQDHYNRYLIEQPDTIELAKRFPVKVFEKYDSFLTEELLCESFARNYLDVSGAIRAIKSMHTTSEIS